MYAMQFFEGSAGRDRPETTDSSEDAHRDQGGAEPAAEAEHDAKLREPDLRRRGLAYIPKTRTYRFL